MFESLGALWPYFESDEWKTGDVAGRTIMFDKDWNIVGRTVYPAADPGFSGCYSKTAVWGLNDLGYWLGYNTTRKNSDACH